MKSYSVRDASYLGSLLLVCLQTTILVAQTTQINGTGNNQKITTNFMSGASLTESEVSQVLQLARSCGIDHPSEVSTFKYVPVGGKGIRVKSVERHDGRNTSFESIIISKNGWNVFKQGKNSKHLGEFWADPDRKHSALLRRYEFNKTSVEILIGEGTDVAVADKVIPLIDAKKVRFESDLARRDFDQLQNSEPYAIYKNSSGMGYELRFNEPIMRVIFFDWKDGQVVVTGVSEIRI